MYRRQFLALASGLLVPEPVCTRAYSFVGGWKRSYLFALHGDFDGWAEKLHETGLELVRPYMRITMVSRGRIEMEVSGWHSPPGEAQFFNDYLGVPFGGKAP